jgi:hypothetical protein
MEVLKSPPRKEAESTTTAVLAFWPSSLALKEFAFLTIGVQLMTAVLCVPGPSALLDILLQLLLG